MEFYKFSLIYYIILVKITILTATYDASKYINIKLIYKIKLYIHPKISN